MTPTITHLTPTVVAVVGLAEDASGAIMGNTNEVVRIYSELEGTIFAKLPQGNWQIVGWYDDLDEVICEGLVEYFGINAETAYKDYGDTVNPFRYPLDTATESFSSLLRSHGIEGRALILRKID